jgi:SAM-dependent methyltransferase
MSQHEQPKTSNNGLLSHGSLPTPSLDARLIKIRERLRLAGEIPGVTVDQQLDLLDELAQTEVGRFLLVNRGLNAFWTHRVVTYEAFGDRRAPEGLERTILETLPTALATRERFNIFQRELQSHVRSGSTLASVPCGFMGDLLLLDYSQVKDVRLLGIDLDPEAIEGAARLAVTHGLDKIASFQKEDAWEMQWEDRLDVLASNGLNIYEPDEERVVALYRRFWNALKPGGLLLTSFLTPPPSLSDTSSWKMDLIDRDALMLQQVLFMRLIEAKWSVFRTHDQTRHHLQAAGFLDIEFIDDAQGMFPTVKASKPI